MTTNSQTAKTYINVMEALVQQEIEKQLKFYPQNLRSYLNTVEVATYALNRLPPLYASSTTGQRQQEYQGGKKYKEEITSAVRRAIAAVERDPLRSCTPIVSEMELQYEEAAQVLHGIQALLSERGLLDYPGQTLNWENCLRVLKKAFDRATGKATTPPPSFTRNVPPPPPAPNPRRTNSNATLW
ncbi:late competence development ComFB family protein [Synechocystis sp. LKSZ1]|uniref:late competence development ComFB family protein n=1 Tax=Synechocystis sp. LKSZ1 TaxID=3144951 RepID=UPI00336BD307